MRPRIDSNTDGVIIMLYVLLSIFVYLSRTASYVAAVVSTTKRWRKSDVSLCKIVRTATIDFDSSFISHRINRFSSIGNETRWAMFMWSSDFFHCLFISLSLSLHCHGLRRGKGKSINAWRFNEPHPHLYSKQCTSSLWYSFSLSLSAALILSTSFALFWSPFLFIFAWILAHPRISS